MRGHLLILPTSTLFDDETLVYFRIWNNSHNLFLETKPDATSNILIFILNVLPEDKALLKDDQKPVLS